MSRSSRNRRRAYESNISTKQRLPTEARSRLENYARRRNFEDKIRFENAFARFEQRFEQVRKKVPARPPGRNPGVRITGSPNTNSVQRAPYQSVTFNTSPILVGAPVQEKKTINPCVQRQVRTEVLHATGVAGSSRPLVPHWNKKSYIKCK